MFCSGFPFFRTVYKRTKDVGVLDFESLECCTNVQKCCHCVDLERVDLSTLLTLVLDFVFVLFVSGKDLSLPTTFLCILFLFCFCLARACSCQPCILDCVDHLCLFLSGEMFGLHPKSVWSYLLSEC